MLVESCLATTSTFYQLFFAQFCKIQIPPNTLQLTLPHPEGSSQQCKAVDLSLNFYMARTLKTREIGFDNLFKRFAHKEFFIDGMGRLAMAQCNLPTVHHAKPAAVFKTTKQGKKQIKISEYERYRQPEYSSKSDTWLQYFQRWYFRSGLEYMAIPVPSEKYLDAIGVDANSKAKRMMNAGIKVVKKEETEVEEGLKME